MRLTLRTMLAYLDGILEPEDSEDLGRKISESEFATGLVHRIRDCTKRIRLGAPKLDARSGSLDPNTVANYLDNTLPAERAPDFEKVCLESDIHLAEVAACHQILTMVLGEPARVESSSRKRVYEIPNRVDELAAGGEKLRIDGEHGAAASLTIEPVRRKRELPDYLSEPSSRRLWLLAAAMLIAAGLTMFVLSGQSWFLAQNTPETGGLNPSTGGGNDGSSPGGAGDSARQPQAGGANGESTPPLFRLDNLPPEDAAADADSPTPPITPLPDVDSERPGPDRTTTVPAIPPSDAVPVPAPDAKDPQPPVAPHDPSGAPKPMEDELAAPPPQPVGRFLSEGAQALLRYDRTSDQWVRLPNGAVLTSGDRLLALPTFRPKIVLHPGVSVQMVEGTLLELLPYQPGSAAGLRLLHGRLTQVMSAGGPARVPIELTAERRAVVVLGDVDSAVALEVRRRYAPGDDPSAAAGPFAADVYVTGGRIEWADLAGGAPKTVAAGHRIHWTGPSDARIEPLAQLPGWIDPPSLSPLDVSSSQQILRELPEGQPVGLAMQDLALHRRREVREMAARGYGYIGEYRALIHGFKEEREAWVWRVKYIGSLHDAMLRGPEEATAVRAALVREFGQDRGSELYRILCGYSPQQLANGADVRLVDWLGHADLMYRVLAFYNLERMTGASHGYKPEDPDPARRTAEQRWRDRLRSGGVVWRDAPELRGAGDAIDPAPADPANDAGANDAAAADADP